MSEDNLNTPRITPSDTGIGDNYVALKPGNYKVRQSLAPFKGTNLTDLEMQLHTPGRMALGVAEPRAAVYIYKQKTIEIVGKVYHGRRLVKPGVYSQFEKLRYLNDDLVEPLEVGVNTHRTAYNKQVRVDNAFVKQTRYDDKHFIEYLFVNFHDQMLTTDGTKVYPIPIINGLLTLYPDGSFETEGIVVRSKDGALVDRVGYLGDKENYGSVITFYNEVTRDDIDPTNVWKKIRENDDGSVTYGAIEANVELQRADWIRLPNNIIPVNDGKVTISDGGWISIEGTVITEEGYPIVTPRLHYNELFKLTLDGENVSEYIDRAVRYNPLLDNDVVLNIVGNPGDELNYRYRYHFHNESYSIYDTERGQVAQYRPMPGWDKFTNRKVVEGNDYTFPSRLLAYSDFHYNRTLDESLGLQQYYPLVFKYPIVFAGCIVYPRMYLSNLMHQPEERVYQLLVDHRLLKADYPYFTLQGGSFDKSTGEYNSELYTTRWSEQPHFAQVNKGVDINAEGLVLDDSQVYSRFIPYYNGFGDEAKPNHVAEVIFTVENGTVYIEVKGTVVWRRNDQYYTLDEGKVPYITDWPDIKEDENGKISLFSDTGYFTDEPIFFKASHEKDEDIGYTLGNIDGIKREEPGLFSLVRRNVTTYLTPWDKYLVDNIKAQVLDYRFDKVTGKVKLIEKYLFNHPFTFSDTNIHLRYHSFKWKNVLPRFCSNVTHFRFHGQDTRLLASLVDYNPLTKSLHLFNQGIAKFRADGMNGLQFSPRSPINSTTHNLTLRRVDEDMLIDAQWQAGRDATIFDNLLDPPIFDRPEPIIIPKSMVLAGNGSVEKVAGMGPRNATLFYRHFSDPRLFSGSVETDHLGYFELPVPKVYSKYGYTEVWLDEPFAHQEGLVAIQYRLGDAVPIIVLEKEKIKPNSEYIHGTSEPSAMISIFEPNGNLLGTKRATRQGTWKMAVTKRLEPGRYTAYQKGIWKTFNNQHDEFTVEAEPYIPNDVISPRELFGDDDYLYLIDIGVGREIPEHLIDGSTDLKVFYSLRSSIIINRERNTYTVYGLLGKPNRLEMGAASLEVFSYLPEGTYRIGSRPEFRHSRILTQRYLNIDPYAGDLEREQHVLYLRQHIERHLKPKTNTALGPAYQMSDRIVSNGPPVTYRRLSFGVEDRYPKDENTLLNALYAQINEDWLIPPRFLYDARQFLLKTTDEKFKQGDFADLNFTKAFKEQMIRGRFGRVRDRIIIEDTLVFEDKLTNKRFYIATNYPLENDTITDKTKKLPDLNPFTIAKGDDVIRRIYTRKDNPSIFAIPWWDTMGEVFFSSAPYYTFPFAKQTDYPTRLHQAFRLAEDGRILTYGLVRPGYRDGDVIWYNKEDNKRYKIVFDRLTSAGGDSGMALVFQIYDWDKLPTYLTPESVEGWGIIYKTPIE